MATENKNLELGIGKSQLGATLEKKRRFGIRAGQKQSYKTGQVKRRWGRHDRELWRGANGPMS